MICVGDKVRFTNEYIREREKNGRTMCIRLLTVVGFSRRDGIMAVSKGRKTPMVYHKDYLQKHI